MTIYPHTPAPDLKRLFNYIRDAPHRNNLRRYMAVVELYRTLQESSASSDLKLLRSATIASLEQINTSDVDMVDLYKYGLEKVHKLPDEAKKTIVAFEGRWRKACKSDTETRETASQAKNKRAGRKVSESKCKTVKIQVIIRRLDLGDKETQQLHPKFSQSSRDNLDSLLWRLNKKFVKEKARGIIDQNPYFYSMQELDALLKGPVSTPINPLPFHMSFDNDAALVICVDSCWYISLETKDPKRFSNVWTVRNLSSDARGVLYNSEEVVPSFRETDWEILWNSYSQANPMTWTKLLARWHAHKVETQLNDKNCSLRAMGTPVLKLRNRVAANQDQEIQPPAAGPDIRNIRASISARDAAAPSASDCGPATAPEEQAKPSGKGTRGDEQHQPPAGPTDVRSMSTSIGAQDTPPMAPVTTDCSRATVAEVQAKPSGKGKKIRARDVPPVNTDPGVKTKNMRYPASGPTAKAMGYGVDAQAGAEAAAAARTRKGSQTGTANVEDRNSAVDRPRRKHVGFVQNTGIVAVDPLPTPVNASEGQTMLILPSVKKHSPSDLTVKTEVDMKRSEGIMLPMRPSAKLSSPATESISNAGAKKGGTVAHTPRIPPPAPAPPHLSDQPASISVLTSQPQAGHHPAQTCTAAGTSATQAESHTLIASPAGGQSQPRPKSEQARTVGLNSDLAGGPLLPSSSNSATTSQTASQPIITSLVSALLQPPTESTRARTAGLNSDLAAVTLPPSGSSSTTKSQVESNSALTTPIKALSQPPTESNQIGTASPTCDLIAASQSPSNSSLVKNKVKFYDALAAPRSAPSQPLPKSHQISTAGTDSDLIAGSQSLSNQVGAAGLKSNAPSQAPSVSGLAKPSPIAPKTTSAPAVQEGWFQWGVRTMRWMGGY
ncbi:hypothetical protein K438DRAFT_1975835 [Mycena galopus ATCC 62051]|nr:hypothetical protein K438DRAFT_1975835 [Mycena galopus ATCC 62051]